MECSVLGKERERYWSNEKIEKCKEFCFIISCIQDSNYSVRFDARGDAKGSIVSGFNELAKELVLPAVWKVRLQK